MTDDHHDPDEDPMPSRTAPPCTAPATETFQRPRLRSVPTDATRLDPAGLFDVAEPTTVTPPVWGTPPSTPYRDAGGRPVYVSAPGTHTRGAPAAVDRLNAMLDERDRKEGERMRTTPPTRGGILRRRTRQAFTVRQEADRRALARMRHERHMENVETVRAYLGALCLVVLFLLIIGMAAVAFAILTGQMTWMPSRV